jgi:hypothetical protein
MTVEYFDKSKADDKQVLAEANREHKLKFDLAALMYKLQVKAAGRVHYSSARDGSESQIPADIECSQDSINDVDFDKAATATSLSYTAGPDVQVCEGTVVMHFFLNPCDNMHTGICMYIHVYMYTYICMYIRVYMYTYICMCMYACTCMCVYVCVYVRMHKYMSDSGICLTNVILPWMSFPGYLIIGLGI